MTPKQKTVRSILPIALAAWWLGAPPAAAQIRRLPPVDATATYPGQLVAYAGSTSEILEMPGEVGLPEQPELPPGARPGMFQRLTFGAAWLPGGGGVSFGVGSLQLESILALPIPSREYPLIITPGFGVHYLEGPPGEGPIADGLPPRVFDAYTQFRWMRRLSPKLGIDLAVTAGAFGDFLQSSDDAIRLTGHGAAAWTASETLKFVLGAAYIDRYSTAVLPIAGLIYTPNESVEYELVFPEPRIARRIYWHGAMTEETEDWIYLAGELGGGIWAVGKDGVGGRRVEMLDYTDYRLFLGLERKAIHGLDARLEIGYVFGRKLRVFGSTWELRPDDTLMLRGELVY